MGDSLRIGLLTPACRGYNAIDGGIASHFADLAVALTDAGHDVRVITPAPSADSRPATELAAVRFVPFPIAMPRWLDRLAGLRWQLHSVAGLRHRISCATAVLAAAARAEPLDVIETTNTGVLASAFARRRHRAPLVTRVSTTAAQLVSHNDAVARWPNRVEQQRELNLARASDALITHTLHHRDEVCRLWHLPPSAFAIVPHGIALPDARELRPPSDRRAIEVLFVGRLEHRKGIDTLLAAIPPLLAACPALRFQLVGYDPSGYWQQRFLLEHPGLPADRVCFAGCLSTADLRAAYRNCDLFVAPSRYESFGLIYVEAMAWGRPVIGCRVGGVPEVIADGETGFLLPPDDAGALVTAVLNLAGDEALRTRLGAAARARVERLYSRATLATNSVAVYRTVRDRRRAPL